MRRLLAIVAMLCVAAVACGKEQPPGVRVRNAAGLARDAGSARFTMTIGLEGAGLDTTVQGSGEMDFAKDLGRMEMNFAGLGFETIFSKSQIYMSSPVFEEALDGKSWVRMDVKALTGAEAGGPLGGLNSDPAQYLDFLKAASDGVTETGSATIRGAETTKYRAQIRTEKALEQLGPAQREAARDVLGDAKTLPTDVWIGDEDGLPRKVSIRVPFNAPGAEPAAETSGTITIAMEFFDYGKPVAIDFPTDDESVELESAAELGRLFGGTGDDR